MIFEKHSKVASKSDESRFWSHLHQPCIDVAVRFIAGRLSCTGAELSIDLKDAGSSLAVPNLSVQPHKGPDPENVEDLVHWQEWLSLEWPRTQHGCWGWEASRSLKEWEKDFYHSCVLCQVSVKKCRGHSRRRFNSWSAMLTIGDPAHSSGDSRFQSE